MTPSDSVKVEPPFAEGTTGTWSRRSLNMLAVLSIIMMVISFVQAFKQYYAQRRLTVAEETASKQPLFDDVSVRPKKQGLDALIPDQQLRDEVIAIEKRLREAREQKMLASKALQQSPRTVPREHYQQQRADIEETLLRIESEQPGLAAPLQERLENLELDAPQRSSY